MRAPHVVPPKTAAFAASQWKQAKGAQPAITCECERVQPIRFMYKCWYCKMWLCDQCAPIHFEMQPVSESEL